MNNKLKFFIEKAPKAELHLHIEGTLEPELIFKIAERNNVKLKYQSIDELKKAYQFNNLQEFLDIYYQGTSVLILEQDFYDMTWNFLKKAKLQNIQHVEIFFDPQSHTIRNIKFETIITGINRALVDGKNKLNISSNLIMCFLRHLTEEDAIKTLEESLKYKEIIIAVGLDSSEINNPPSKFQRVFKKAIEKGFLTVAHAGEEGPTEYIWEAINLLEVSRIDHGNCSIKDEKLTKLLTDKKIPLTICPLSNLKLKVVDNIINHPLKKMIDENLMVTINSDDPAYFGGYLNDNYLITTEALKLSEQEVLKIIKNSFESSFIPQKKKDYFISKVDECYKKIFIHK